MKIFVTKSKVSNLDAHLQDNRDNIIEYHNGSVLNYLLESFEQADQGVIDYLTDDQMEYYDKSNPKEKTKIKNIIIEFINDNYNYDISKY